MAVSLITITVQVDGHLYTTDLVADVEDVMFAVAAGRAVSETLIQHPRRVREQKEES